MSKPISQEEIDEVDGKSKDRVLDHKDPTTRNEIFR